MHLTRHTDYALRLLIYLASKPDERISIAEAAAAQEISRTHLMKIANALVHSGFVVAARGRSGGLQLARAPALINLGEVVATTEPGCRLIDCTGCKLIRLCKLPGILDKASAAFHHVLVNYSLADLIAEERMGRVTMARVDARHK